MRHDMSRVLVERPRYGDIWTRKGRPVPFDHLPSKQGMQRPYLERGAYKDLNENLGPLRRFLERQVGRPWNDVYSEIARNLRVTSTVQQHVRDHLPNFVQLNAHGRMPGQLDVGDPWPWYEPLYVDPVDGILRRTGDLPEVRKVRRLRKEMHTRRRPLEIVDIGDRQLRKIEGLWYEVIFAELPPPEYRAYLVLEEVLRSIYFDSPVRLIERVVRRLITPGCFDVVTGEAILAGPPTDDEASRKRYLAEHPERRYAIAKRQVSRRELRRHGLSNARD
ncbi:MAG: hypothetical protein J0H82_26710 [Alphaproteobacteria bacterium]|jgi:hypothetical protein|nr:hypothetical protein [Alphaproteobacteria bacterium]